MVTGLTLNTGALIWYAQIPVDGTYVHDLLGGYLMFGFGLAFAFIPVSIAALAGVGPREAGLASGLLNTRSRSAARSASRSRRASPYRTATHLLADRVTRRRLR